MDRKRKRDDDGADPKKITRMADWGSLRWKMPPDFTVNILRQLRCRDLANLRITDKEYRRTIDKNLISIMDSLKKGFSDLYDDNTDEMRDFKMKRDWPSFERVCEAGEKIGEKKLFNAAIDGHLEKVKRLIKGAGIDPNSADIDGRTPIFYATIFGHLDVIKYLVEEAKVQDPNKANKYGVTPIYSAAQEGYLDVVEYLFEKAEADPNKAANDGETPIYAAAPWGHLDVIKYLVKQAKADPNKANNKGETPIYVAASWGRLNVVKYLIEEAKANPNIANNDGNTPIDAAARSRHNDVVEYLRSIN